MGYRQQINKLMRELQARKRLGWVKNKGGQVLTDPVAIAQALEEHRAEVTSPGLYSLEDCMAFLRKLKLPSNFAIMARALFRPLSESLVAEVLDRLHCSSSPGFDGIYKAFREFFQPLIFETAQNSFSQGSLLPLLGLGSHKLHSQGRRPGDGFQATSYSATRRQKEMAHEYCVFASRANFSAINP